MLLPPLAVYESLHAIRYFAGLRQTAMAEILGMTQGWLSKCEAGVGDITVDHLVRLKREFGLSSDAVIDGNIPYLSLAERSGFKPRMPARYAGEAGTSVRVLYGFLRLFERRTGRTKTQNFWKQLGLPEQILAEPNYPIHVRVLVDVVDYGLKQKLLATQRDWQEVVTLNLAAQIPALTSSFSDSRSSEESFRRFLDLCHSFSRDLGFSLRKSGRSSAELLLKGSGELDRVEITNSAAVQKLKTNYSRALIRQAAQQICGSKVNLQESVAAASGRARRGALVYHVRW